MGMGDNHKGLYGLLDYLHKAKVLNIMCAGIKSDNIFTKPEVAANDTEIGSGNKIPLWLFGFMY